MKKALAILYSPKTLVDFIWYYHTFGKEYAWDVLCIPYGGKEMIDRYCVNSNIFRNIYMTKTCFETLPKSKMAVLALKMIMSCVIGKSKQFAKDYLKPFVNDQDYDLHLVPSDYSLLCGLLVALSSEVETIILEDGLGDYTVRSKKFCRNYGLNLANIASYFLSVLGYGTGIGLVSYINKPNCQCVKYSVHPEWMLYKGYKDIRVLRDLTNTDIKAWKKCLRKTFAIREDLKLEGEIILFTAPMGDFVSKLSQQLADEVVQYISSKYHPQKIYIKKHYRDEAEYKFPMTTEVEEIEKSIPGELLLDLIQCKKHIYMFPSNMLISYTEYSECEVLKFRELADYMDVYEKIVDGNVHRLKIPSGCVSII